MNSLYHNFYVFVVVVGQMTSGLQGHKLICDIKWIKPYKSSKVEKIIIFIMTPPVIPNFQK